MQIVAIGLLIIVAMAVLNRVRGGGFYGDKLPGRALLWVTPVVGVLGGLVAPAVTVNAPFFGSTTGQWPVGIAWALAYLFWGLWSWGHVLAGLGSYTPNRSPSTLEAFLALFGHPIAQTFVRMLFVLPGVALVAWLIGDWRLLAAAPAFALAATAAYALLFRPLGTYDWTRAEIATGAIWGWLLLSPMVLQ